MEPAWKVADIRFVDRIILLSAFLVGLQGLAPVSTAPCVRQQLRTLKGTVREREEPKTAAENDKFTSVSRRNFLKTTSIAGALSLAPLTVSASPTDQSARLQIDMAGYAYDRVQAIMDGRIDIAGCDTNFQVDFCFLL